MATKDLFNGRPLYGGGGVRLGAGRQRLLQSLIDAESKGGMQVREQADAPAWLEAEAKVAGKGWEKAAKAWIAEDLKQRRTGSPTAWRKQAIARPEGVVAQQPGFQAAGA